VTETTFYLNGTPISVPGGDPVQPTQVTASAPFTPGTNALRVVLTKISAFPPAIDVAGLVALEGGTPISIDVGYIEPRVVASETEQPVGRIAFVSHRDGDAEIYVMDADGSNQDRLTNSPGPDRGPAWSPDGTRIAFSTTRGGDEEICIMNADGSNPVPFTNNPGVSDWNLAWSPDGSKIAWICCRSGAGGVIKVMNVNGSGLGSIPGNTQNDQPDWSPDGSRIVFTSYRDGNNEVYVMGSNGSGQTPLTNNPGDDWYPDWSPDGTTILFTQGSAMFTMGANGCCQTPLPPSNNTNYGLGPVWSPDGARIASARSHGGNNLEIYVMNADGSKYLRLTNDPQQDSDPDWKP